MQTSDPASIEQTDAVTSQIEPQDPALSTGAPRALAVTALLAGALAFYNGALAEPPPDPLLSPMVLGYLAALCALSAVLLGGMGFVLLYFVILHPSGRRHLGFRYATILLVTAAVSSLAAALLISCPRSAREAVAGPPAAEARR